MELQRFRGHDLDVLESRDVIGHMTLDPQYMVSYRYRWSFETKTLYRIVAEILCFVKDLAIENALIPIFVFWGQNRGSWHFSALCV